MKTIDETDLPQSPGDETDPSAVETSKETSDESGVFRYKIASSEDPSFGRFGGG